MKIKEGIVIDDGQLDIKTWHIVGMDDKPICEVGALGKGLFDKEFRACELTGRLAEVELKRLREAGADVKLAFGPCPHTDNDLRDAMAFF